MDEDVTQASAPEVPLLDRIPDQLTIDKEFLAQNIVALRQAIFGHKLNYHLAAAGLPTDAPDGKNHPQQWKEKVEVAGKVLAIFERFAEAGEGVPVPPKLDIASAIGSVADLPAATGA